MQKNMFLIPQSAQQCDFFSDIDLISLTQPFYRLSVRYIYLRLILQRQHQQRLHIQPLSKLLSRCTINILSKFIILYFNTFIFPRPRNLYVILVRHNKLPEDDILNVETCRSMLFVIIVFGVIVQTLIKL